MTPETCIKFIKTSELYLRMTEPKRSACKQHENTPVLFSEYRKTKKH
jgi:hypothetical protein